MQVYNGVGVTKVTIDSENLNIIGTLSGRTIKEKHMLSDIVSITWIEPTYRKPIYAIARIKIAKKDGFERTIPFDYEHHDDLLALYNFLAEYLSLPPHTYTEEDRKKAEAATEAKYKKAQFNHNLLKLAFALFVASVILRACGGFI